MARHDTQLEVTKVKTIKTSHEGDHHLMGDTRLLQAFSDNDLCDINLCRVYLQVMTLSNMAEADGKPMSVGISQWQEALQSLLSTLVAMPARHDHQAAKPLLEESFRSHACLCWVGPP